MQLVPGCIPLWALGRAYVSTFDALRFMTRLCSSFWSDTLTFPIYAAAFSVLVLTLQTVLHFVWTRQRSETAHAEGDTASRPTVRGTLFARFGKHVHALGGWVIAIFRITRLVALGVLLGLSAYTFARAQKHSLGRHGIDNPRWRHLGLVIVYVSLHSAASR